MAKPLSRAHQDELVAFEKTGAQDCSNVIDADDFLQYMRDHPSDTPKQVVDGVWKQYEDDGLEADTIEQWEDIPTGLDPRQCYRWWSNGWKGRALGYAQAWHREFQRALKDELG